MVTGAGLVLLVYLLVRLEHLLASAIWVWARGSGWIAEVGNSQVDLEDPIAAADSFDRHGGGRLPFLFFGVKSYRMRRWVRILKDSGRNRQSLVIQFVRSILWQYWIALLWISPLVMFLGRKPLDGLTQWVILSCAFVLLLALITICMELWVAGQQMGSWTSFYHRMRIVPYNAPNQRARGLENMFALVALVYTCLLSTVPLQFVVRQQFPPVGKDTSSGVLWNLLDAIVQVVLSPLVVVGYLSGDIGVSSNGEHLVRTAANLGCFIAWAVVGWVRVEFKGEISDRS